ncbi:MAG: excinuclease ABC subunit UvrB [Firmicutes bacterium]|nr:excinuclease ABC subunit UvrB [Bacillota bacterium]
MKKSKTKQNILEANFKVIAPYQPAGDQPQAIASLVEGARDGNFCQVLLGVTGSGKTFTMANVIQQLGRPTLIVAHNKTLAAQLCNEFREFFPHNLVEFFVSYYDYYQPEAYVPSKDLYIEKELLLNDEIDKLRNSATSSLLTRRDVVVVASVSCIYGLGAPEEYYRLSVHIRQGEKISRDDLLRRLVAVQYQRNDYEVARGIVRVKGDVVDVFPMHKTEIFYRVEFFGDEIERILEVNAATSVASATLSTITFFPASHYAVEYERMMAAMSQIESDLWLTYNQFKEDGKLIEAERIKQRTLYDLEMMRETGSCKGIENYSRYFDGRLPGQPPFTLLDYFPKGMLVIVDESHITLPQVRGMYGGDYARKKNLIEHGFRLPSAYDNRPLNFDEFIARIPQLICVSATPADYEKQLSNNTIVGKIVRPTGLLDPIVEVRQVEGQVLDLIEEVRGVVKNEGRVLVTTLTKKMAESLTKYLAEQGIKVRYMHSDIDTLERVDIINGLRRGDFDVLVGINLLREGLDLPEVMLVAILDADKEGFLRSESSLIQTIGRAARNDKGRVIMYADKITKSMDKAISETSKRREIQKAYNKKHGITPKTIKKGVVNTLEITKKIDYASTLSAGEIKNEIEKLKALMQLASNALDFEKAIEIREHIAVLKKRLVKMRK